MNSLVKIGSNVVVCKIPQTSNLHRMNLQAQTLYYIPLIPMVLQVIKKEKKIKKKNFVRKPRRNALKEKSRTQLEAGTCLQ